MSLPAVLGLDLSTQSLSLVVLSGDFNDTTQWKTEAEFCVNFDEELPHYNTRGGVVRDADGMTVTSPAKMWVEALDVLLERLATSQWDFSRVCAVSVSGQQHGSVYWKEGTADLLSRLDPQRSLLEQLTGAFSRDNSPIWMDSSTNHICKEIEVSFARNSLNAKALVGGSSAVSALTGSKCFERFTIHQIVKIHREDPEAMKNTERISLVSSFLTSLLASRYAPIDPADGSGMNVDEILEFAAPGVDLKQKLGEISDSHEFVSHVSSYLQKRYGFPPSCKVIMGSGDNPCTMAGLKLRLGDMAVSLGTSDTLIGPIKSLQPSQDVGSMMCSPLVPTEYMGMICMKNGSLTRQEVRNKYANHDWDQYSTLLQSTNPGNDGKIGFYFYEREISPFVKGTYFFDANGTAVSENDWKPEAHIRAVVESQFLLIYLHSRTIGFDVKGILATGGGSKNKPILQVLSNVFGVPVFTGEVSKSAALGAAYRALHGWICHERQTYLPFTDVVGHLVYSNKIDPEMSQHQIYLDSIPRFKSLLRQVTETK